MLKTEMQIERDFYSFVKGSSLGRGIRGGVYRSEMRPWNAKTEDLVVKFLAGTDGQVQSGVVVLNIYVPDVQHNPGTSVADKVRIGELQELLQSFVAGAGGVEYLLNTDGTPVTMKDESLGQHFIYARIYFKRITE